MNEIRKGICPFYRYRVTDRSETITCEATHESVSFLDTDSLTEFAIKIDKDCLGFDYVKCPEYKKKMKEQKKEGKSGTW